VIALSCFDYIEGAQVACERFDSTVYGNYFMLRRCQMDDATVINEDDVTISTADNSVRVLSFYNNKKINFLPIQVSEKFPKLIIYSASSCSVKTISRKHFAGMKIEQIFLHKNQIEKINSDVFQDLVSLEHLDICTKDKLWLSFDFLIQNFNKFQMATK
jgi:hypothetical protein